MTAPSYLVTARPSRAVSLVASAALALVWVLLRVVVFGDFLFPLTYVLPLLVCVWSRDRTALWSMAVFFVAAHTVSQTRALGPAPAADLVWWATFLATFTNIVVAALVIHAIIGLRERLEQALSDTRAQADEVRAQREELAVQGEELAAQNEELAQQNEELAAQNEELLTQRQEIEQLNDALERRGTMLQTLLDASRLGDGQADALHRICEATIPLVGEPVTAAAIFDLDAGRLIVRASSGSLDMPTGVVPEPQAARTFAMLAIGERRTAALDDITQRPDLVVLGAGTTPTIRAVLCAPLLVDGVPRGAVTIYSGRPHHWTTEQFRLADWLAHQAARVLESIRLHEELRQQAEALRETDRRKDEFLATLSHELRNPLAPIRFALRLLDSPPTPAQPDPRQVIERQVQHLVRLVDDLLDATRIRSNKIPLRRSWIDLVRVVQDAIAACQAEFERAQLTAQVSLPPGPVWLHADADRLTQVLTNLLNNATRYTPPGGRVSVTVARRDDQIELAVGDTGIGLEPADLRRVFDMFTQVGGPGAGGLGIGLALVKGLVELHGGTVEARSEGVGRGAEFVVRLPVTHGQPAAAVDAPDRSGNAAWSRRVLIVDDNLDSAEMMATLLEVHGHDVRVASDGPAAVAVAAEFRPHVALLDIGLPGLSGYQVAERLRADPRTSGIHLIAITGWGQDADRLRAKVSGFNTHLTKPADPEQIVRLVAEAGGKTDGQPA